MIEHHQIILKPRVRGIYLITDEVINELPNLPQSGILHLFLQHTSAGITINENADASVRMDFESYMNRIVPENMPFIIHDIEGPDDMPAHVKCSLVGFSVSIPIINGMLALGTWQGVYLCEFRNNLHRRKILVSIWT